jgi:hypothetical protein
LNAHAEIAVDPWSHWRNAVAERKPVDVPKNEVAFGYYRGRDNECVAFLPDGEGGVTVWRSGTFPPPKHWDETVDLFARVCMRPVSHEDATHKGEHGRWPDEVAPVAVDADLPPHEQATAKLTAQREAMAAWIKEIGKVTTQEHADKAGSYADAFAKIEKEAEAARKAEKKQHDDAAAAVQKKWVPVVDRAAELKVYAKKTVEPFLLAEKARLDAIEAERKRAAEEARLAAQKAAEDAAGEPPPAAPVAPAAPAFIPPPAKAKAGKVHLTTRTVHEIQDYRTVLEYLAKLNDHPAELKTVVQTIVNRMSFAGVTVPGVVTKTVEGAA